MTLQAKFPNGTGLQYMLLDALYDQDDEDERVAFENGMEAIWSLLDQAPPLPTSQVQQVETESKKLKDKIAEKEELLAAIENKQ